MWQGIVGHDHLAERFKQSLASGRFASSYLFLGPEGVGKRSFALQLAKTLLCAHASSESLVACEKCESCLLCAAGNHPDVDVVGLLPGKRWLSVEQFLGDREHRNQQGLCHNISLRPTMGRRRVAIIDDADRLTTESSNCLLKTLEEPPGGSVLILIGTVRSRQLPTILSRTQIMRFAPLSVEQVEQLLLTKGLVADQDVAQHLAARSNGSLLLANGESELDLVEFRPRLLSTLSSEPLNAGRFVAMVQDYLADAGAESEAKRKRLRMVVHLVTEFFASELKGCATKRSSPHRWSADRLLVALDRCLDAEEHLERNANQATLVECWFDEVERALHSTNSNRP